jgi:excisionase family DNA binding protein
MPELLPLADAASLLGVSVERVRQLVVAGQLPGQRFGNAWAVPKEAIVARRHSPGSRGRPLGPRRAWQDILAGDVDLGNPGRYQHRAELIRCQMSRADVAAIPRIVDALIGGVGAAIELGEQLPGDARVDVYLSASSLDKLDESVAYVPAPAGPIALRVVDDSAWQHIPKHHLAPRAAVALDLLESSDPRHWIAAEHLNSSRG